MNLTTQKITAQRADGENLRYHPHTENVYSFDPGSDFDPRCMMETSRQDELHSLQTNMAGSNFSGLNFERADFRHYFLNGSDFSGSILRLADFSHADLVGVNLRSADLASANLQDANLEKADLRGADLERAAVENMKCDGAIINGHTVLPFDQAKAISLGMISQF